MKKDDNLVLLSSDDEDCGGRSSSSKRSYRKTKSGTTFVRKNTRQAKKARLLGSQSCLSQDSRNVDEFKLFCEDFDQVFSTFKVSAGPGSIDNNELWIDKYKPRSIEELAVHKKKVQEVKLWFEERLRSPKDVSNYVLVITGPAGVGKSATVRVIASHIGARLCEWDTPTPVLWQEHQHNVSAGIQYTSKLDEFENFIERMRKYGAISACLPGESNKPVILLMDDLPLIHGKAALRRLQNCLHLFVQLTQVPTAILITDCAKAETTDLTVRYLEEIQLCLENAGACKVSFNPITNNSIKKIISRICRQEKYNLAAEQIDAIAKVSGGDIRHAIMSSQIFCLKPSQICSLSSSSAPAYVKENEEVPIVVNDGFSFQFGRDETLSLFHGLGKFLHNKRQIKNDTVPGSVFVVQEGLSRLPLKMDPPEKILCQAHGQARPVADFLHENVLEFMNEEAIDDAWAVASYLGDADALLSAYEGMLARHNDAENILPLAAASVAVRGVLFGNSNPLPSRWHAIRRPKLWQIERSSLYNKNEMVKQRFIAYSGLSSTDISVIATEYQPASKWLGNNASHDQENLRVLTKGDPDFDLINSEGEESHISDDEIEDW